MSKIYNMEIVNSGSNTTYGNVTTPIDYVGKVGLMYLSDYGYAASQSEWNTELETYDGTKDWLCRQVDEWLMTRVSYDGYASVFIIHDLCNVYNKWSWGYAEEADNADQSAVRPVVYLKQGTVIDFTHAGTSADPYRIS